MSQTIFRIEKTKNYSVVSNAMIRDTRLSFAARGLLAFLLTLPDDWDVNTKHLITQSPLGREGVHKLLRELKEFGYLHREQVILDHKIFGAVIVTVFESPQLNQHFAPETVPPYTEEPFTESPYTAKPLLLNTNKKLIPKKKQNTKGDISDSFSSDELQAAQEVFDYWQIVCDYPDSIFDEARKGIIIARLRDGLSVEQIKLAIDGCSQDSFSQGENKDGKKYDGIMRICKNAESVESLAEQGEQARMYREIQRVQSERHAGAV